MSAIQKRPSKESFYLNMKEAKERAQYWNADKSGQFKPVSETRSQSSSPETKK
tara:strand:+ start:1869 stop:2027 length:159 start_codon:yes stop_codon:yes gene_type:complete